MYIQHVGTFFLYEQDSKQFHEGLVGCCCCWWEWYYCTRVIYSLGEEGLTFKHDSHPNENRFLREESDTLFHYFMALLQYFFTIFKTFLAQSLSSRNFQSLTLLFISQIYSKFSVISIPGLCLLIQRPEFNKLQL